MGAKKKLRQKDRTAIRNALGEYPSDYSDGRVLIELRYSTYGGAVVRGAEVCEILGIAAESLEVKDLYPNPGCETCGYGEADIVEFILPLEAVRAFADAS